MSKNGACNMRKTSGNPHKKELHKDGRLYGKYKRKPDMQITSEDLARALKGKTTSYMHTPVFLKATRDRAFTAALFWLGARKLEPAQLRKEDMQLKDGFLFLKVPAFKGGERGGVLKINVKRPGVNYIIEQWRRTRKGRHVFQVSPSTAYRIIKRALGVCPHWLRHSWITWAQKNLEGSPSEVDRKIMAWTGIKQRGTLDSYRMKTEKDIAEIAEIEI